MRAMYRRAMCDWIAECDQFEYEEDEEEARAGLCDKSLTRFIERNYVGGVSGFIYDTLISHALVDAISAMSYDRRRAYLQRLGARYELGLGSAFFGTFVSALERHFVVR